MFVTNGIALRMFEDHSFDEVTVSYFLLLLRSGAYSTII